MRTLAFTLLMLLTSAAQAGEGRNCHCSKKHRPAPPVCTSCGPRMYDYRRQFNYAWNDPRATTYPSGLMIAPLALPSEFDASTPPLLGAHPDSAMGYDPRFLRIDTPAEQEARQSRVFAAPR